MTSPMRQAGRPASDDARRPALKPALALAPEMGFARGAADRVIVMDTGRVIEMNAPDAFFQLPQHERSKLFLSQILR